MRGTGVMYVLEEQGITKELLSTTHDVEGGCSCTCREKSKTWSFLEAFERQRVWSGIRRSWPVIFEMLYTELESLGGKVWRRQYGETSV